MIDITFLLLIFFLVASKMDSPASGELPTAVANRPIMADKAIVLNIEKNGLSPPYLIKSHGQSTLNNLLNNVTRKTLTIIEVSNIDKSYIL